MGYLCVFHQQCVSAIAGAVCINDIDGYIHVLPSIIFTLDRPNKGYCFLHKLEEIDPKAHEILKAGAVCTNKLYARKAVYLDLEQTAIRYAASPMRLLLSEYQKVLARGGISLSLSVVWHCWSSINLLIFNQEGIF